MISSCKTDEEVEPYTDGDGSLTEQFCNVPFLRNCYKIEMRPIYYVRITPSHPLNKPTNDIGSAPDFPAGAIKPNYGTNTQTDVSLPVKTSPISSTPWRTGANLGAGNKVDNYRVPENPINNKGNRNANGNGPVIYSGNHEESDTLTAMRLRGSTMVSKLSGERPA